MRVDVPAPEGCQLSCSRGPPGPAGPGSPAAGSCTPGTATAGHSTACSAPRSGSPRRPRLQAADVPITLAEGQRDLVPVPGRAAGFAAAAPTVRHLTHPDAAHLMPLSEGHWCATLIAVGRGGR
jgi:hypothetical protein